MRLHAPAPPVSPAAPPRLRRGVLILPLLSLLLVASGCASSGSTTPPSPTAATMATANTTAPEAPVEPGAIPAAAVADSAAATAIDPAPADAAIDPDTENAATATASPVTAVAPAMAPTQAELDFAAIYGDPGQTEAYNPVFDPTLPEPAKVATRYDPWEPYNRKMHAFNNFIDRTIARPLARAYVATVPRPVRLGVSNFFSNLGQPVSAVNALLQGKPTAAAQAVGRFALNSTLGIGGIFDPASDADLPRMDEDFGQTLGVWGWRQSRYVELPLFGPRTVRDVVGLFGDAPLSPLRQVGDDAIRIPLQGLQLVDVRTQLLSTDSLRVGAADDYALVRDAWSQRRDYQIFGDRLDADEVALPDYMNDDNLPIVPVGAIPVMPPQG